MKLSVHLFLTDILPAKRRLIHRVVKNKIFGKLLPAEVFSKMKKAGIDGFEVLLPNFATEDDIIDLKKLAKENDMKVFSVHQDWRFLTTTRMPEIEKLFRYAKMLSAEVIVLHINSAKKQIFDKNYVENLHTLQNEYGIKVGFENMEKHAGSILNSNVWHEKKFADILKTNDFHITLDTCHLGQAGGNIIRFTNENFSRIVNIHLSDFKPHYLNNTLRPMRYKHMKLGEGILPINDFLVALKTKKYKGIITLEIESNLEGLLECAKIVRSTS